MKFRTLLLVVLVFLGADVFAQQLVVSVTDDENKAVELAYVNIYSTDRALLQTVQTDEAGFANVTVAKYPIILEVVAQGYESFSQSLSGAPTLASYPVTIRKKFSSLNE